MLKNSFHFVSLTGIPQIEASTPFHEVYAQLSNSKRGGFILTEGGWPKNYVKAYKLAENIVNKNKNNVEEMKKISNIPIGQLLSMNRELSGEVIVPIGRDSVDISSEETTLQNQSDTVFRVSESGEFIGWYLNHETVLNTHTEKTVFFCEKGHENTDPDHGTCYRCPFPIVGTKKR